MLSREENELVTRIGPGTPMGNLMREYWVPALMSNELPEPDGDPVRVLLLGEKLVAFRDTHGRVGLLRHSCPHRGGPLFLGRNEEDGLRCVYHGWKFDVNGFCVDMPNEPAESDFKHKVKRAGYPCVERGGLVWAYLGPRSEPPSMPALDVFDAPDDEIDAGAMLTNCNWLQVIEGDLDTVHFTFLHAGHLKPEDAEPGSFLEYQLKHRSLRYQLCDTDFGFTCGAYRPAGDPDHLYWRIAHFMFPCYSLVPTGVLGTRREVSLSVPMDDEHTMRFQMGVRAAKRSDQKVGMGSLMSPTMPNTTDWFGRWRSPRNAGNDYLLDREMQRRGDSFTGIDAIDLEDIAMTELMGPIFDRTGEHLGSTDMAVIRLRRRLLAAAKALAEEGRTPPGVDDPEVYQQRSGGVVLHRDEDWLEATADLRQAGIDHPELDRTLAGGS